MRPPVIHVRDHELRVDPHSMFVSRGGPVVVHLDREDGSVDMWRIEGSKATSLGVARSIGDCGCP